MGVRFCGFIALIVDTPLLAPSFFPITENCEDKDCEHAHGPVDKSFIHDNLVEQGIAHPANSPNIPDSYAPPRSAKPAKVFCRRTLISPPATSAPPANKDSPQEQQANLSTSNSTTEAEEGAFPRAQQQEANPCASNSTPEAQGDSIPPTEQQAADPCASSSTPEAQGGATGGISGRNESQDAVSEDHSATEAALNSAQAPSDETPSAASQTQQDSDFSEGANSAPASSPRPDQTVKDALARSLLSDCSMCVEV